MQFNSVYRLAQGVQVRSETFGLLFYDYRGPRLYFVPSKHLIGDDFFQGIQTVRDLLEQVCSDFPHQRARIERQLGRVLETLERKGLIRGESIC